MNKTINTGTLRIILAGTVAVLLLIISSKIALAADLIINNQSGITIENQFYDKLIITNSSNITIEDCTFSGRTGNVVDISGSNNINLRNSDIDGLSEACSGIQVSNSSYIYIIDNRIHDIADDGVELVNSNHITFAGNTIHTLLGYGTDSGGPCFNGHSDGIELTNVDDSIFDGNLIYDVRSTSAFFPMNTGSYCDNITLSNNIFYTPESGFVAYFHYLNNPIVFNNIFWKARYGGVAVNASTVRGMVARNNVTQSWNFNHHGFPQTNEQDIDYSLIGQTAGQGYSLNAHDIVAADPRFQRIPAYTSSTTYRDVSPSDFELQNGSAAIDAGISLPRTPETDFYGNDRSASPDMGAIESGGSVPDPPSDSTPPVLSNVGARDITTTSASITWNTNEPSSGQVEYGTSESYGSTTPESSSLVTAHSVSLSNLLPSTIYHFRVRSQDAAGNLRESEDYTFTTLTPGQVVEVLTVASVNASIDDGNIPENTLDDDLGTRWSAEGDGQWIEYDLGVESSIAYLMIAFYRGDQRASSFEIQTSPDGLSWETVIQTQSSGTTLEQERFELSNTQARFIRILGHGNSDNAWNSITEVDCYGTAQQLALPSVPTNLVITQ